MNAYAKQKQIHKYRKQTSGYRRGEGQIRGMYKIKGFPGSSESKESACSAGDPRVRKIPWRSEWQPTRVFLPGKTHGKRSLAGYSPWIHKESWLSN